MPKDKILVYHDYQDEPFPRLSNASKEYVPWLRDMYELFRGEQMPNIPDERETSVKAFVSAGRWLWQCLGCNSAIPAEDRLPTSELPSHYGHPSICPECATQGWVDVVFPRSRRTLENELLKQPGRRANAPIRDWKLGWKMRDLHQRTTKAQSLLAAGKHVRSLSVATTKAWSVGEVLTAANMNSHVTNPIDDLVGRIGPNTGGGAPVEFENAIIIDSLTTTERNALTATNGMLIYNSTLNVFQRYENGEWVDHTQANTLTLASGAQGDALFLNSSGTVTRLAAGTDRQALRTHGSNADPTFADLEDIRVAGTTARGEIVFIGSNGRLNRLAAGANRQALRTHGSDADPTFADLEDLRIASTVARGDVFFVGSNSRLNRLGPGTSGYFFQTKGANADPAWASVSASATFTRITTTGTSTWTVPPSANMVYVEEVGGGGGGRTSIAGASWGEGGEGGLVSRNFFLASTLGTSVTVIVGAGGAVNAAGGNSVFAGHAVGLGGVAGPATGTTPVYHRPQATGQSGANGGAGGAGGTVGGGAGTAGAAGLPTTITGGAGGTGGTGVVGGPGSAGTNSTNGLGSGGGGGGGGNATLNSGAGGAGGVPGGGGGGSGRLPSGSTGTAGTAGVGGRGEVRIWAW